MISMIPEQGQLVYLRYKYFIIQDVHGYTDLYGNTSHRVTLESIDEYDMGETLDVIWELEHNVKTYESGAIPTAEKWDSLDRFEAYIRAITWSTQSAVEGNQFISPFSSAIDIEYYQLDPLNRALAMPKVNLLLADDVGLGKTIETGLIFQELLSRKRIRRIMILCPSSLQIKWKEEMESKFQIPFLIINHNEIQNLRREYGIHVNPWDTFPRVITSFDFLKRETPLNLFLQSLRKQHGSNPIKDWDMLIVDEAHNVAPSGSKNYIQDSDRTKLLMTIIENFENRVFLTATPHNGYTESFTALLEMLDPLRFSRGPTLDKKHLQTVMVRRLKEEIEDALGRKKFSTRIIRTFTTDLRDEETHLYELLNKYTKSRIMRSQSRVSVQFVSVLLKKRLLSSPLAFHKSIETHYKTIRSQSEHTDEDLLKKYYSRTVEDWDDDDEKNQYEDTTIEEASKFFELNDLEMRWLEDMRMTSLKLKNKIDSKTNTLLKWIYQNMQTQNKWNNERLIIFTEYKDTVEYLQQIFDCEGFSEHVAILTGGMNEKERELIKQSFQSHPDSSPIRILIGTDAISEGIDLQNYCRNLIHWEIPWNPNRMEQRNGRIDRHGQASPEVFIWHFVFQNNEDSQFLQTIIEKVERMRNDLGSVGSVIENQVEKAMLGQLQNQEFKINSITDNINKIKYDMDYEKINNRRLSELRNKLEKSRQELEINPENLFLLLNEGLKLVNHVGLRPVESGELKGFGYILSKMPDSWIDLDSDIRDTQGRLKYLIFDPSARINKNNVVLLHLNHPLIRRAINEFRGNIWAEGLHGNQRLHKSSYKILPESLLKFPGVIVFLRIIAINKSKNKIHESIKTIGAEINKNQLIWLDEFNTQSLLRMKGRYAEIPKHIGDFLRSNFINYESQIKNKISEIQDEETTRIKNLLIEMIRNETALVKSLIKERIKEINTRIYHFTTYQTRITNFTDEENQQLDEDIRWLRKRKLALEHQLTLEPQKIKLKFELSDEIKIFPIGVLYLLPESLLGR